MFLYEEVDSGLCGEGRGESQHLHLFLPSLFMIELRSRILVTCEWGAHPGNWDGDAGGLLSVCMRYVKAS